MASQERKHSKLGRGTTPNAQQMQSSSGAGKPPLPKQIPLETAAEYLRTVADMNEAMIRNGYYMPQDEKVKSMAWMLGVQSGEFYCPKYADIVKKPCPRPPPKLVLLDMVLQMVADRGEPPHVLGFEDKRKCPESAWLIDLLASDKHRNYEIFEKGYRPSLTTEQQLLQLSVPNPDAFYDGLPVLTGKKATKRVTAFVSAEEKANLMLLRAKAAEEKRLRKYEIRMAKLVAKKNKLRKTAVTHDQVMELRKYIATQATHNKSLTDVDLSNPQQLQQYMFENQSMNDTLNTTFSALMQDLDNTKNLNDADEEKFGVDAVVASIKQAGAGDKADASMEQLRFRI